MAAFLVQALARNVRSADALITAGELGFLRQLLQFVSNDCAAREKHGKSWPDVVVENEKFEFFAELAMVALLCFAFIISARHVRELERADVSRAHDVRACAEINEVAAAIERDFLVTRNVFDDVDLVFAWLWTFAHRCEPSLFAELQRFVARNFHALEWMVRLDLLFHLRLDLFEILG